MEFYYIRFAIEWTVWLIFADKKRWRELLPVCFFASLLASLTDTLMHHHKLWDYDDGYSVVPYILNELGIYIVVTYLFIQYLPTNKALAQMFWYWFVWTLICIAIEWVHVYTSHLKYHQWWHMGWSYIADWVLFWIFYKYHQIFQFKKLLEHK